MIKDIVLESKLSKMYSKRLLRLNKDIKDYLILKNTQNLNRKLLAKLIHKLRLEKIESLYQAKTDFPSLDYTKEYNTY